MVLLLCKDKIFSRMLEIELKNAGCKVVSANSDLDTNTCVRIRDTDTKTIEITSSTDSVKRTFSRPFYVRDVVNYVLSIVKDEKPESPVIPKYEPIDREAYYDLSIDDEARKVTFRNDEISLTKREYELLIYLYANKGKPVSRDEAVAKVWKYDFTGDTNIVDVYIRYLREKLDDRYNTKLIYTVRHKGYMIK
jgi:Response regulators consisting of a CheY-like receiver domain and a winged-helix DNA-binding domain